MSLTKLSNFMEEAQKDHNTSFGKFTRDYRKYREEGWCLTYMTINSFLEEFQGFVGEGCEYLTTNDKKNETNYEVYLLVDISGSTKHTMSSDMKKKYRKCGKERRIRLDQKYNYEVNIFNRIHGFIIVQHSPGIAGDKTLAINVICSSNYTCVKGIGSYMMKSIIHFAKLAGYKDIVLEVGSDAIEHYIEDEESEDESDEESEESDEESEESEEEYDSDDYEVDIDQVITDVSDMIAEELWKKSVRHRNTIPYYSFGSVYVCSILEAILANNTNKDPLPDIIRNEEYGYGGYYYHKAKRLSKPLIQYYETFGFKEDPSVHKTLKCFSELPFPSFRLQLQ